MARKWLAARYKKPGFAVFDYNIYAICGDGCLMEGISHEACSLAGTWGLGKLIALWDDNHISIDGNTDGWFTDDTAARFEAYGWQVIRGVDGHDPVEIAQAIRTARAAAARRPRVDPTTQERPSEESRSEKKSLQIRRADAGTRTPDPIITSDVLYQLSYVGASLKSSRTTAAT